VVLGVSRHRGLLVVAAPAFVAALAVGLVGSLALSNRGSPSAAPLTDLATASTPSAGTSSPSESTHPSPKPSKVKQAELPKPPATTSGGLTARTLPSAKSLGVGWVFRVDSGSAEGGYVGNGTPTMARKPSEVAMTVLPLGCDQRSDLPMATNVLETDYKQHSHTTAGVALRLRFASSKEAGQFVTARRDDLAACAKQPIGPADDGLHLVTGLASTGQGTYVSVRTDPTLPKAQQTWTEVAGWLGGRDVVLLAINAAPKSAVVDVQRDSTAVRAVLG
jgi:hypothetical protein